jgi:ketosteroid isomerase-like protein
MTDSQSIDAPSTVLARLERAANAHDLNALVACFAPDYRNDTPTHPERSFTGREQVRRNWEQIFAFIPDITTTVLRSAVQGDEVWSEWEHRGTRQDGSAHTMRGVVIFGVGDNLLTWARFYLEPVLQGGEGIDATVRRQVTANRPAQVSSPEQQ